MRYEPLPSFGDAFDLRVTLLHIEPVVWRRVRIPAHATLGDLHDGLQIAFGWKNCHLHDFQIADVRFAMSDVEDELFSVDERAAPLGAVTRAGKKFVYRYDYGDDWEHEVSVERMSEGGDEVTCTDGARACPPEDCGGPPGYERLLEVLADPDDEEHADMKVWVGRKFDPEKFDASAVNKKLATLSKRLARRRA